MRRFLLATAAVSLLLSAAAAAQPSEPSFTPERFRAHVAFLADDRLEGRDAGTRGFDIGALYVASQFESLGLKPAGDDGWYQKVPFAQFTVDGPATAVSVGGRRFPHGEGVVVSPAAEAGTQTIDAPVVFAGYGIDAPETGIEDYKGLDVRGKIVAVLGGYPKDLPSDVGAHLNSEKRRMAEQNGAIGIITVRTNAETKNRPWARVVARAGEPMLTWIGKDGAAYSPAPGVRFRATFDSAAAEALFAGARTPLRKVLVEADRAGGRPKGFALKQSVRFEQSNTRSETVSENVVAMLPGSDPVLAGETVLLMAHLDHLGIHGDGQDKINNGAMDNATGVATMLEVARAMRQSGVRPKRSILFAAVTAEEDGLLGAQYLANNPVAPKMVGVVNLDMPVLLYDFQDVIAFGAEHSTMGPIVASAAGKMGVALSPDPLPQEGLFTRSDHYRFVQKGVPSVFLMTGFANGGKEKFTGFLANTYHGPKDDLQQPIDWQAGAKFARINYLIAREIADSPQAPRWYADSFFGKTLAGSQPKAQR